MSPIYLDANASEPALPAARDAARSALEVVGNPSSPHAAGRKARTLLDSARDAVAAMLGAHSKEVVFTSGASEGNRWAVDALAAHLKPGAALVTTTLEHPSVAKPLARPRLDVATVPLHSVLDAIGAEDVRAAFVTAAHNETGLIVDLASLCHEVRDDVIVCVDASQAVARLAPLPARVDVIVCSAHKLGGLPGVGAMVVRGRARDLKPPWTGGGQEGGLRPGTENVVGIAAFGAAAKVIDDTRGRARALMPLRDRIERALVAAWGARVVGEGARLPNTTALMVPDVDGEALRIAIDLAGVCVGFGAACSALAPEPSPSLMSLGLSPAEARATVRISLPLGTTEAIVADAIARLAPVAAALRANARR